ncbi:MAG: ABC transporter permease [Deltaproteobacteria bacterium]|nr:ABC transporter permease [Deltaproteobacteria bacterium]
MSSNHNIKHQNTHAIKHGILLKQKCYLNITWLFTAFLSCIFICVLIGSLWLFSSNYNQTNSNAIHTLFSRSWFWRSLWLSILTATTTTIIAVVLGVPTAYALSRFHFRGRKIAGTLLDSILVLPASTVGLTLMVALQYPPVLALQDALGIRIVHSLTGIILAQLILSLAFGIQAWRAAFASVNQRYEHVARSLGSSRIRTFFTVTLPLARSGIIAGLVLAWTRALAEFGAVLLVAGTFRMRTINQFSQLSQWLGINNADALAVGMWMEIEGGRTEQGVAIAFVMLAVATVCVYLLHHLANIKVSRSMI